MDVFSMFLNTIGSNNYFFLLPTGLVDSLMF